MTSDKLIELADKHNVPIFGELRNLIRSVASNELTLDPTDRVANQLAAQKRHQAPTGGGSYNV